MISVHADYAALARRLDVRTKQLPFAGARALTRTAGIAAKAITAELPAIFDRPAPFTQRAIAIQPASKASLTARVFVKSAQAKYLTLEETGGVREPAKVALVVPVGATLNQYGNMPRFLLKRLLAGKRSGVFIGTIHGIGGFWQRLPGGHLRLIAAFRREASYKPRFQFRHRVGQLVKAHFMTELQASYRQALATAR